MQGRMRIALLAIGLCLLFVLPAAADPWPSWDALSLWPYYTVNVSQDPSDSNIFIYSVTVDPESSMTGWAIKAFVPYVTDISSQPYSQGSSAYDGGNTAGWTNTNGGWEIGKYDNQAADNAAFGWLTGSPTTYVYSGSTVEFNAILGSTASGWDQTRFGVHVAPPDGRETFWAYNGGDPVIPEPASLLLVGSGLGALFTWHKLRKVRRTE